MTNVSAIQAAMDAGDIPAIAEELDAGEEVTATVTAYSDTEDIYWLTTSNGQHWRVDDHGPEREWFDEDHPNDFGAPDWDGPDGDEHEAMDDAMAEFNYRAIALYEEWGIFALQRRAIQRAIEESAE